MIFVLLLFALFASGCGSTESTDMWYVQTTVMDDENMPVAGTRIVLGDKRAVTDKNGVVTQRIQGREGDSVQTQVFCPPNWQAASRENQRLVLKKVSTDSQGTGHTLSLRFQCVPQSKEHVLVVKSNGKANLPVQINGRTIAWTNGDGIAQVVISGRQNEQIQLTLQTSEQPQLIPRNPSVLITLPQKRKILVFEQTFANAQISQPHHRKRIKRIRSGPRRL